LDTAKTARSALFIFLATFVGLGISYIFGVLVARWFGPSAYGQFSLGFTLFTILSIFSVFGLDNALLKYMPDYSRLGKQNSQVNLLYSATTIGITTSGVISIALFFSSSYLSNSLFDDGGVQQLIKIFSFAIPAYVLTTILCAALQSKHDVFIRVSAKYFSEPVSKLFITFILLMFGLNIEAAAIGVVLSLWISVFISFYGVKLYLKRSSLSFYGAHGVIDSIKQLYKYSSPLMVGLLFVTIANKSDFILLGYFQSSYEVGLYAAAFQTTAIIIIILQTVESVVAPHLSEALSHSNSHNINKLYTMSLRWVLVIGIPVFVFFLLHTEYILSMFGDEFVGASAAFTILVFGHFMNLATGSSNYILLFLGKTKYVMLNQIVNSLMLLSLNFILIKEYSLIGAAVSMLISTIVLNIIRIYQVYKFTGEHPYDIYLLKPALSGLVMFLFLLYFQSGSLIHDLVLFLISCVIYLGIVIILGVKQSDKQAIKALLP